MKRDLQKRPHTTRDLYKRLMKMICLRNKADSMSETGQGWVLVYMKNHLHVWKETYTCAKKPTKKTTYKKGQTQMKIDPHTWKKTYKNLMIWARQDMVGCMYIWKETYTYQKGQTQMKRDPHTWKKTYNKADDMSETGYGWVHVHMKRDLHTWKETYKKQMIWVRQDKVGCTYIWKETYKKGQTQMKSDRPHMKRDLLYMKRDLQKRPHIKWDQYKRPMRVSSLRNTLILWARQD